MQCSDNKSYFQYLKQRSFVGQIYRNWLLYPRLSSCLQGRSLDFGCGIGDYLRFRENTMGVDINQYNVDYCNALNLNTKLIQNGHIPFQDNYFASVVMDNVLEHIPEDSVDVVLVELLRVLQPGGRLLIGVPDLKGYDSDDDHKCFYLEHDVVALFERYDCRKVKSFHMPFHIPWLGKYVKQYCVYTLFESS